MCVKSFTVTPPNWERFLFGRVVKYASRTRCRIHLLYLALHAQISYSTLSTAHFNRREKITNSRAALLT